jgi:ribokinase
LIAFCDQLPCEGKILLGAEFTISGGGRGANCAVAAARAGCEVTFVGAYGIDPFGTMAKELMEKEPINLDHFVQLEGINTGVGLGAIDQNTGKHVFIAARSANDHVTPEMVRTDRNSWRITQALKPDCLEFSSSSSRSWIG